MSNTPTPIVPNPLTDLMSPKVRKYLYAGLWLALVLWATWQAVHGDWSEFFASLASSFVPGLAASNTAPKRRGVRRP